MKAEGHTGVIIVLYNTAKIQHYQSQADPSTTLIIVDNTPDHDLNPTPTQNIIYHQLKRNLGIAAAQNAGIEIAKEIGCSHVVFFDQDSTPPKGFINDMVTEYDRIESRCPSLFLLGPTVINGRTSEVLNRPFIKTGKPTMVLSRVGNSSARRAAFRCAK